MKLTILATVLAAVLALAGGHAAAIAACPPPAAYPGDDASKPAKARWMAEGAAAAGLPAELPVMGALVESDLRNLGGDDSAGYFGMRVSMWDNGEYAGFRESPELQLKWFIDHALAVRHGSRPATLASARIRRRGASGSPTCCDPLRSSAGDISRDSRRPAR